MFKRQFLEPFANLVNYVFVPVNRPRLPLCLAHPRPERGRITHTNHTDKRTPIAYCLGAGSGKLGWRKERRTAALMSHWLSGMVRLLCMARRSYRGGGGLSTRDKTHTQINSQTD